MLDAWAPIDASGVGIRRHVSPPSIVRTIAAQGEPRHSARPSSQPSEGDTNVNETGVKLARSDPCPGPTAGDALGVDGVTLPCLDGVATAVGVAPGGGLAVISRLVGAVPLAQLARITAVISKTWSQVCHPAPGRTAFAFIYG